MPPSTDKQERDERNERGKATESVRNGRRHQVANRGSTWKLSPTKACQNLRSVKSPRVGAKVSVPVNS